MAELEEDDDVRGLFSEDPEKLREELHDLVDEAHENEVRAMLMAARRWVRFGQKEYGPLQLHDGRENPIERTRELIDDLLYGLKERLEQTDNRRMARELHDAVRSGDTEKSQKLLLELERRCKNSAMLWRTMRGTLDK